MIVVMQEGASEAQIQSVIDRLVSLNFTVHRSTGVMHTLLGGVGPEDNIDAAQFEIMDGVKEAHLIATRCADDDRGGAYGRRDLSVLHRRLPAG